MAVHKDCYTSFNLAQQGGLRRRETLSGLEESVKVDACREITALKERFKFGIRPSDQPKDTGTAVANQ